jgi:hypothetical protein
MGILWAKKQTKDVKVTTLKKKKKNTIVIVMLFNGG